jgi:hypothetical protein
VERYGLWSFVWAINTALSRLIPRYNSASVDQRYLELWQQATIDSLGVRPLFREKPKGIATDEAVAYFLGEVDWRALGAKPASLPNDAEPVIIDGKMRRRVGDEYQRIRCPWGELYICNGLPGFFSPAF